MLPLCIVFVFTSLLLTIRGKSLHNFLVDQAARIFRESGAEVREEYPVRLPDGQADYLDLLARWHDLILGCEVETTARHVADNIAKARSLDMRVWVVVPNRKVRSTVRQTLAHIGDRSGGQPIQLLLIGELVQAVRNFLSLFSAADYTAEKQKTNRPADQTERAQQGSDVETGG